MSRKSSFQLKIQPHWIKTIMLSFHCPTRIEDQLTHSACLMSIRLRLSWSLAKEIFSLCKCNFINVLQRIHTSVSKFDLERISFWTHTLAKRPVITDQTRIKRGFLLKHSVLKPSVQILTSWYLHVRSRFRMLKQLTFAHGVFIYALLPGIILQATPFLYKQDEQWKLTADIMPITLRGRFLFPGNKLKDCVTSVMLWWRRPNLDGLFFLWECKVPYANTRTFTFSGKFQQDGVEETEVELNKSLWFRQEN